MSKINNLKAKEILNSRGKPTIEVELETNNGLFQASVPTGTSKGRHEAKEVKAKKAVFNVNQIMAPKLIGKDPTKQKQIDKSMPKKLGANAILAVSIAVCRAGAASKNLPLYQYIHELIRGRASDNFPKPAVLLIEGGMHAKNKLDFQEFMIVTSFQQAKEIYHKLGRILNADLGYEGGFAPQISDHREALDLIMEAVEGYEVKIGLDCAASHFKKNKYNIDFYEDLVKRYPIIFLEDPFSEDDWQNWQKITKKLGKKTIIVGDDLLTTNIKRIKQAKEKKACNGAVIKPNQIGTVSETIEAAKLAKSYGWKIMVSHRAGDTLDDFIADLAVGVGADFIKSGAPSQPERLAKYKRLIKIGKEYG